MRQGQGRQVLTPSLPVSQEVQLTEEDEQDRRWIVDSESRSSLLFLSVSSTTTPHSRRNISFLTSHVDNFDELPVSHTRKISVTLPLPQIVSGHVSELRTASVDPEVAMPALVDKMSITAKHEPPIYNIRTVVRKENHPLWSPSTLTQLEYLFGLQKLGHSSLPKDVQMACSGELGLPRIMERPLLLSEGESHGSCSKITSIGVGEQQQDSGSLRTSSNEYLAIRDRTDPLGREQLWAVCHSSFELQTGLQGLGPREVASLIPMLLRDESVCRQVIVEKERHEALLTLAMPPHATFNWIHPALVAGIEEITIMEEIRRKYILEEESNQIAPIWDFYVFEHRCLVVGTKKLTCFLRRWILTYRGRKMRQLEQLNSLWRREEKSRLEIIQTWLEAQKRLFTRLVIATESQFRVVIEELQLHAQYAHGLISISLKAQTELFFHLYGAVMPRAIACGRISGCTRFKLLDLNDQHGRGCLSSWEEKGRLAISCMMQREALEKFLEGPKRQQIVEEELVARGRLTCILFAMLERCHRREIEIVEACECQLDVLPHFNAPLALGEQQNEEKQAVLYLTSVQGCPS
ncbi:hypothetical protein C3747_111g177 [Trypanosoma cruzi]|uniref:Uncharacterized protein n=2 Tax=Trypanosoma cruzi TaxID=5693 RepID=Q4CXW5_TRYCC|nr:hypothetical protein, conserved [Trypanosoma cruzi]EAN85119.1 hypothetical protein, conserved [Trypanosoma cruzi]PWV06698.1 hypothetical protein C3747_111g177 [Trypanosoma cruzi]RNC55380.1 hypothetical protein TcCL_ESM07136 [Trypanosoma cruzi]|eukprot:XP_806970.1 hypothetical protein [Trypanosoma cruzi strain CL Brener]